MAENEVSVGKIQQMLDWAYEKSLDGIPGMDSAYEMAENFLSKHDTSDKAIDSLIRWQNTKAATSGFLTGLGGIIVLPVTLPANVASVMYVQVRMIAAIAHMKGYDLKDDQVKTFVFVCLTGKSASDIFKSTGIKIGNSFAKQGVIKIPGKVITAINQKVGFRLLTKFGEKGAINLGKAIPIAGGVIGGAVDGIGTGIIGKIAKKVFV
ncbi:EcsC family protein [Planococcus plakortidis]|uniref:EcsC family protein n=1 Tax=Planococcus plakortidis TaxID=1038856 RepID=UPI00385EF17A